MAWMLIGLGAGWLGVYLFKGQGLGIIRYMVAGTSGAFVGGYASSLLVIVAERVIESLALALLGSAVFILVVRLISGRLRGTA